MTGGVLDLTYDDRDGDYELPGNCSNCDWEGIIRLSKGTEAPRHGTSLHTARCPRCGCKTVGKSIDRMASLRKGALV